MTRLLATDAAQPHDAVAGFAPLDLYQRREKIYTRAVEGRFQRLRTLFGLAAAARLSVAAVARLGRAPGGAVRHRVAPVLHLRRHVLAAGFHSARGAADHRRVRVVHRDVGGWPRLVRLYLSADDLDRDLHVDRAGDRGPAPRAYPTRPRAMELREGCGGAARNTRCGSAGHSSPASRSSAISRRCANWRPTWSR